MKNNEYQWDGKQKTTARQYAIGNVQPASAAIFMPGSMGLCVKEAKKIGIIHEKTHVILVERDPCVLPLVKKLGNTINDCRIWPHDLTTLKLDRQIDFAFLDFLGTFDLNILNWIAKILGPRCNQSTISITHTYGWRNNNFLYRVQEKIKNTNEYIALQNYHRNFDDCIMVPLFLLKSALKQFDYELRWPVKYQDSVRSMLVFRIDKIQPRSDWVGLEEFSSNNLVALHT